VLGWNDLQAANKMPRRIDFAKERRTHARSLGSAVREITGLIESLSPQNRIDFHARLKESSARNSEEELLLAERLQESVTPLFIVDPRGRPDRTGSCVLVRLGSDFLVFTAAHVIREAKTAHFFAPSEGKGGKLIPLPPYTAYMSTREGDSDLDVGVLALQARLLGPLQRRIFLDSEQIDEKDQPDDTSLESFYLVLGYSGSRTQVKVSNAERRIHQQSFRFSTHPVDTAEYVQEKLPQSNHILLDFDHNEIKVEGRLASPPRLQGVSGGGIFHISRKIKRGPLVAIATENRRRSRLIVGTRIKHFLALVRELKTTSAL
jgi:hypothetical protein